MRIDKNINILYENITYDNAIRRGDILTGRVIDIEGENLILFINDIGVINAISEENLKPHIDKEMTFIVESLNKKAIKIKPTIGGEKKRQDLKSLYKKEEYIENVFKEFNIEKNKLNKEFIKSLMEYSVKLDENNIRVGIDLLNKLKKLIELHESKEYIDNEFKHLNTIKENSYKEHSSIEDNYIMERDYVAKLQYLLKDKGIDILPKTIAFFIKYNIKPSFINIKNFIELNLDLEIFSEDYEKLKKIIGKEFTNHYKNIIIGNESPKNLIKESRNMYLNIVDRTLEHLKKENTKTSIEIKDIIKEFKNKLELIKELNNGLNFIYLPIHMNSDLKSIITLIKKKRCKYDFDDTTNVFIRLKTVNLGNINICIKVNKSNMRIKFESLDKESLEYIKSKEEYLKEVVEFIGFDITSIDYVDSGTLSILNILTVDSNPLYCLDVKV